MGQAEKASEVTIEIIEIVFIVTLVASFLLSWAMTIWQAQGEPVALFGDGDQVYIEPANAGQLTSVKMPIALTRKCVPLAGESRQHFLQGETRLVQPAAGAMPDFGPPGVANTSFKFQIQVPAELEPGPAVFYWTLTWDCGLRRVEMVSPIASMDVLP